MAFGIEDITDLDVIYEEEIEINNMLINMAFPLSDTSSSITGNLFGKKRKITLSGSHSGGSYSGGTAALKIKAFIANMEAWVNAGIQPKRVFEDSFGNTYSVLCAVFRWARAPPGNRILYVITMIEGGSTEDYSPPE